MKRLFKPVMIWATVLAILLCVQGCVRAPEPSAVVGADGEPCGVTRGLFRHKWWNYYERGQSFQDCDMWAEAEADFREALDRADQDDRRARTYGMHFLEYFPHRELGVTLFHLARYEAAVKELETSLSQQPSAKAEFYLDKARRSLIQERALDARPPEIAVTAPEEDWLTREASVRVTGVVRDDTFVKAVHVNGQPVRIDLARPEVAFDMDVAVSPGAGAVVVEAWDLAGRRSRAVRTLFCDRSGPLLAVSDASGERLKGAIRDDGGIRQVWVDGVPLLKRPVPEVTLDRLLPPGGAVQVLAEDMAGNRSRAKFPLRFTADAFPAGRPLWASLASDAVYLAAADQAAPEPVFRSTVSERRVKYLTRGYLMEGVDYALIVGIDQYEQWQPLKTAVNDAAGLRNVLVKWYGYQPENVILRTDGDATRSVIINDLRNLAAGLSEKDNLLVYFAGHGQLDNLIQEGYWIPVEGGEGDAASWVPHSLVKQIICSEKVKGRHILVIADSCYAGSLLRGGTPMPPLSTDFQARVLEEGRKRSRQVIASGGLEPVADGGREDHSLFAYYLLKSLEENTTPVIDMESLFVSGVKLQVARIGIQRPTMERLQTPMDEDGQFVLVRRDLLPDAMADASPEDVPSPEPRADRMRVPAARTSPLEQDPPELDLKRWTEQNEVYLAEAFFEGAAKDASGLQRISVNGENLLKRESDKAACFNYVCNLKPGDNPFVIECVDVHGNKTEKRVVIHRKIQKIEDVDARMAMVYLPFSEPALESPEVRSFLQHELEGTDRFNVKPGRMRGKPEDVRAVSRLVRELGGDYWLEGRILQKERSVDVFATVYETDELTVMTEQNVYSEDLSRDGVEQLCRGLMVKLKDAFPRIDGYIVKVKKDEVIINRGETHNLKKGMRLIFYREGEPIVDSETNEVLEAAEIETVADARVERVRSKVAYVRPDDPSAVSELAPGLKLITK